jgi:glycosyltransferase involved in cell wall biosynthesis
VRGNIVLSGKLDGEGVSGVRRLIARVKWKLDRKKRWVADLRREAAAEHALTRARLDAELDSIRREADERQEKIAKLEGDLAALQARFDSTAAELQEERSESLAQRREIHTQIGLVETLLTEAIVPTPVAAPAAAGEPPEVSIVMPVYNRARFAPQAIDSVLRQSHADWELLIVDDGSEDDLAGAIAPYLADPRIRLLREPHRGSTAARNAALRGARGAVIAYLDSDNLWAPNFLSLAADALRRDPEVDLVYGVLSSAHHGLGDHVLLFRPFDREALLEANYIDMNVVVHRASLVQRFGGFDEALSRMVDWDMMLRYSEHRPAQGIPALAARYRVVDSLRITDNAPVWPNLVMIRAKHYPPAHLKGPLRVLYAVWHYPQLSETYIETELRCLRRWGVDVEVWRAEGVASPYPTDIPIHCGALEDAVKAVRPDLIHVHWAGFALQQAEALAKTGLPVTLRMHGFDITADSFRALLDNEWLRGVYAFPAQLALLSGPDARVKTVPAAFDTALFRPGHDKDRRLVVRAGSALKSKDIGFAFALAKRLPEFRFIYAGITCKNVEPYVEELRALKTQMDSPVELRFDVARADIAELIGRAGFYLHTATAPGDPGASPLGMPVSIAESMATGAYVLARNAPEFRDYIGDAGAFYDDIDEAERLIRATLDWSDEDWRRAERRAVERAFEGFADTMVYRTIFEDWRQIVDEARVAASPDSGVTSS